MCKHVVLDGTHLKREIKSTLEAHFTTAALTQGLKTPPISTRRFLFKTRDELCVCVRETGSFVVQSSVTAVAQCQLMLFETNKSRQGFCLLS